MLRFATSVPFTRVKGEDTVQLSKAERGGRTDDSEGLTVAKVIEFYIPTKFSKLVKWTPPPQRGKVIEFCLPTKKSA